MGYRWFLLFIVIVAVTAGASGLRLSAAPVGAQEFALIMDYPGNRFYPGSLTVKMGLPVRLFVTTLTREHVNRLSIEPWVKQSDVAMPGQVIVVEFTPDKVGTFKIMNVGHRFTAQLNVVESK
jgi:heme/copper-type cytochrome/quinol oxidase subunit 2